MNLWRKWYGTNLIMMMMISRGTETTYNGPLTIVPTLFSVNVMGYSYRNGLRRSCEDGVVGNHLVWIQD